MFLGLAYQWIVASVGRIHAARRRRRAVRQIRALPHHLQKDLGWPQMYYPRAPQCCSD